MLGEISRKEQLVLVTMFILLLIGIFFAFTDIKYLHGVYVREDGFIEWLTVLALFLGSLLCLYRASTIKLRRGGLFLLGLLVLSGIYFFGAGEEISWGQRILGVKSSQFFMDYNSQGETNLHNLVLSGVKVNRLIFGTLLGICVASYLLFLPLLYRKYQWVNNLIDMGAVPIPRNIHIICYILLFTLISFTPSAKKGELLEFGGCWIFFLITLNPLNAELFINKR
ncbi:MAG: hypothetical protein HN353_02895 [Bdellovibrionales bacterium]|jgi:hypothetical protein|nr:hypothetical protein [Bdellovibrionales bacterium]MBT3527147.1 hypothetical protein [Bdellovibrionales bacterium]MBT7670491.1 hypothetical protein [Bdellovibrionales bacterium]MBT7766657.1 hypothetical protein [Bdellovibrionales bacterium]